MFKNQDSPQWASDDDTIAAALRILKARYTSATGQLKPDSPALQTVIDALRLEYAPEDREHAGAIWLDAGHKLLSVECISIGTTTSVNAPMREWLRAGLALNASAVILWHTHPDGDPQPSHADVAATKAWVPLFAAAEITVLAHYVIGADGQRIINPDGSLRNVPGQPQPGDVTKAPTAARRPV